MNFCTKMEFWPQCVKRKYATPHANHRTWKDDRNPLIILFCWAVTQNCSILVWTLKKLFTNIWKWRLVYIFSILRRSRILFPMPCCQGLPKDEEGQSFSLIRGQFLILSHDIFSIDFWSNLETKAVNWNIIEYSKLPIWRIFWF